MLAREHPEFSQASLKRLQGTGAFIASVSSLFPCPVILTEKCFCLTGNIQVVCSGFCYCFLMYPPWLRLKHVLEDLKCPYDTLLKSTYFEIIKKGKDASQGVF